jgi:hypothetical protein
LPDERSRSESTQKGQEEPVTTLDEQFEALYGPLTPFSDFNKGEQITYRAEGQTRTGKIVWVATTTRIDGQDIPVQYIVECDQHSGISDNVWQSDIVMDPKEYGEEPAMVKCPYCGGMHYADQVKLSTFTLASSIIMTDSCHDGSR